MVEVGPWHCRQRTCGEEWTRLKICEGAGGRCCRAFKESLDLSGVILTKADGDARGGAALSVREITGKPILFLGTGEKTEALEPFDAERMATRILGMGDVVALVQEVQKNVDTQEAERSPVGLLRVHVASQHLLHDARH